MNSLAKDSKIEIIQKSNWVDITFDKNYQVTYKIINNRILHCKAKGYCSRIGLEKALLFSNELIKEYFNSYEFIYIEDFLQLSGIANDAREHYISYMQSQNKMLALIYHNVSSIFKLSIKLAKWLNIIKFKVYISRDFEEALEISKTILHNKNFQRGDSAAKILESQPVKENIKGYKITGSGIIHKSDNYISTYEIIAGNIFHTKQQGHFQAHDVIPVIDGNKKAIKTILLDHKQYYMIVRIKGIKVSFKARQKYLHEMIKLYKAMPFKILIFYGANWLVKSAILLSKSQAPFPVEIVSSIDDVLKLISKKEKKKLKHPITSFFKKKKSKRISEEEVEKHIDDLMGFLGNINWEIEGIDKKSFSPPHLFEPLYEGFTLLKMELDEQNKKRKLAEQQRVRLQEKLERSMKMEAVGTVAGGVAHDLNNVLGGMIAYPEMILMELPDDSPLREDIETIYQSGIKAAAIVQDLLTLTRRGVMISQPVDVNKIINDYFLSPEFKKIKKFHPSVEFNKKLDTNLRIVDGSPVHLLKIVMNLISNCAEAIEGKGKVEISSYNCKKDTPSCYGKFEDDSIVIQISDTGIGIPEDELGKIFEPFFTKKKMGISGTGLGMTVVWNTINDHKGFIDVQSELNKGTTFYLYFPVSKKHSLAEQKTDKYANLSGNGFVLIVDDIPEQREIACTILKKLGYETDSVSSGERAVEYIKKKPADLLILDMIMDPGIDGLETYKQILHYFPEQKAILASGFSEPESIKELFSMKNIKYIKKPYTILQIGQVVKDMINKDLT